MRHKSTLRVLVPLIGVLAVCAAGWGLFDSSPGQPIPYTNHRGEHVILNGQGLYKYDTISSAAQAQGNDLITLVVGVPLLAVSAWFALKGSLRGQLLLAGGLGFFLYTYMSMAMLASYNSLFLVYVALFSLSLIAFILSLASFDLSDLKSHFSPRLPVGWLASLLFLVAGFLLLAWLGRIVPPLLVGETPVLENSTTLVIQAMDLGLVVPLAVISGILLLRRDSWGYLLASVALIKGATLGLAVSAMGINMSLRGVGDNPALVVPFLILTLLSLGAVAVLMRNIGPRPKADMDLDPAK